MSIARAAFRSDTPTRCRWHCPTAPVRQPQGPPRSLRPSLPSRDSTPPRRTSPICATSCSHGDATPTAASADPSTRHATATRPASETAAGPPAPWSTSATAGSGRTRAGPQREQRVEAGSRAPSRAYASRSNQHRQLPAAQKKRDRVSRPGAIAAGIAAQTFPSSPRRTRCSRRATGPAGKFEPVDRPIELRRS